MLSLAKVLCAVLLNIRFGDALNSKLPITREFEC